MGKIRDRMEQDLAMASYAPSTRAQYVAAAVRFVRRFVRSPEALGQEHLRVHVAELGASGLGASALKVQIAGLKFLYEKTLGRPNEVAWMSWPRPPRGLPRVLDMVEIVALLGALISPLYRIVAIVLYATGLRITEAITLRVTDIDAARGVIRVRGKGGKMREVKLGAKLLSALRTYWRSARPPLPYLFVSPRTGLPVRAEAVRTALRRARADAGLHKHVTPHMLRHSFASHLLDAGCLGEIRTLTRFGRENSARDYAALEYLRWSPPTLRNATILPRVGGSTGRLAGASPSSDMCGRSLL